MTEILQNDIEILFTRCKEAIGEAASKGYSVMLIAKRVSGVPDRQGLSFHHIHTPTDDAPAPVHRSSELSFVSNAEIDNFLNLRIEKEG